MGNSKCPSVMVVDDEVRFLKTMTRILRNRGFPVRSASSGEETMERLAENGDIDVVILDVKMPGMDGIKTLKEIKLLYPLVEVILLTGHGTVESAIDGMKLGACDYLLKPVDPNTLIAKISSVQDRALRTDRLVTLGTLAAKVAHEINNPLSALRTYVKLMLKLIERGQFTHGRLDDIKRYLLCMEDESRRCSDMAKNFLTFSRQSRIDMKPCSILEILNNSISLMSYDIRHQGIQVIKEIEHELPAIQCDANQIQQVFVNLLSNAVQAMPEGGTLTVKACTSAESNSVEVAITDTGHGIPANQRALIFEPFFTTKAESEGIGLGLAVVKSIIARHKGTIHVESPPIGLEQPTGTRFCVRLPLTGKGPHPFNDLQ